jgi:lipopolysaccharide transport protein LptA
MVNNFPSRGACLLLLAATVPLQLPAADTGARPRGCQGIELKWDDIAGNIRGGQFNIRQLELWSCDSRGVETMRVRADAATGPDTDFRTGEWNLTGNVLVTIPEGELRANTAVLVLKDRAITSATVHGAPATFLQRAGSGNAGVNNARGEAPVIRFDVASGDVTLSGGMWIAFQDTEFRCSRFVYNLASQGYRGDADRDKGELCQGQSRKNATGERDAGAGGNPP